MSRHNHSRAGRLLDGVLWALIGLLAAVATQLLFPAYATAALGLLTGVAVGGLYTATSRFGNRTIATTVFTLSAGIVVGSLTAAVVSLRWLPEISTITLGYAVGILASWLLVSGISLDELGGFASIGGLLLAVIGGAAGVLSVPDSVLFLSILFAGFVAGFLVPLSGLLAGVLWTDPSPRRSSDDELEPVTRFVIEAVAVAGLAVAVPFGSRALALFGYGGPTGYLVGTVCGAGGSVGLLRLGGSQSERFDRLRARFVELVYRMIDRIKKWAERRQRGSQQSPDESAGGDGDGGEVAATGDDEGVVATATSLVDGMADRIANRELVIEAADRLDTMVGSTDGFGDGLGRFWDRFGSALARTNRSSGAALQLSAAEEARTEGDTERAQSLTDAALELAAPTIGSVAAAVVRGRRRGTANILDALAPLLARIDAILDDEQMPEEPDDTDQFQFIQRILERLIGGEESEGFDSALSTIRAAAADGWYSVQAGDQALEKGNYGRALIAYLSAIEAYQRAYDIATEATETATKKRKQPDDAADPTTEGEQTVTASAETYASEASRIATALEAILHDTAAVTIAAIDELYGEAPPPTVDTEARRTIVRCLRRMRGTRTRIDATVPPVGLADDRYQRAEIARSVARLRRHLSNADDTAAGGNVAAAAEQYDRVADRLDVLSNRAGNKGLTDLARSLTKAGAAVGALAENPTPEAIADRPTLELPTVDSRRAPEVAPVGRRLRRTFCSPAFIELWTFTEEASDHELLDTVGEPYPELLGSVEMALTSLDPVYTDPDVESLLGWVAETSQNVLSAAVETASERYSDLSEATPQPPPAFLDPPPVIEEGSVATVPIGEGVDVFGETWLSRATELAEATATIERRHSAVDGFAAMEPKVRTTLQEAGELDSSQVSAELLEVAAYHLTGVEYDPEAAVLTKTGEIERREHGDPEPEEPVSEPQTTD